MSIPKPPLPARIIASLIFRGGGDSADTNDLLSALAMLEGQFGPIDYRSPVFPFSQTDYYVKEMGAPLLRRIVSFKEVVARDRLVDIKLFTNEVEKRFSDKLGGRSINIDPGLLSLENLVLATGKNFSHRIYLREGIFAEVTLLYQRGRFRSLAWTYPDYASDEITAIMSEIRQHLVHELRGRQP